MKKFFALVLAVAMIMSMAAVSMAANANADFEVYGPFDYDSDTDQMSGMGGIQYGDTAYFILTEKGKAISEYEQVEKLKLKVDFEMGEEAVESVSIVKKYVEAYASIKEGVYTPNAVTYYLPTATVGSLEVAQDGYYYFIGVKLAKSTSVSDVDVIGTFELNRKAKTENKVIVVTELDEKEVDFEINASINKGWLKNADYVLATDKADLKWDTDYALKFDNDDEIELSFGSTNDGNNEGTFTVDVSGQGKLYLRYDTKLADAIAEANPGVKIFAVNFNGVKFNRVGEFAYEMEGGVAAYKVVDGALVEIPGCEYDEGDETFFFNTRVLENYVFANAELVNPVVEAPVVEAPVATNPSTGA